MSRTLELIPLTWVNIQTVHFIDWVNSDEFDRKYAQNSLRAMKTVLKRFASFVRDHDVESAKEVNSMVLRHYRRSMVQNGLKTSSISHDMTYMRFFFDYLVFAGDIEKNPVDVFIEEDKNRRQRGGRIEKRLPTVLMITQQNALMDYLDQQDRIASERNTAIIGVLLDSGMRVDEFTRLSIEDGASMLTHHSVRVIGKGNKERKVVMMDHYANHWENYIRQRIMDAKSNSEPLFLSKVSNKTGKRLRMSQVAIYYIVSTAIRVLEFNVSQLGPHLMRHSAASRMLHDGRSLRDVQETMGHDSITTTEKYLHLVE